MSYRIASLASLLVLATAAPGQQPAAPPPRAEPVLVQSTPTPGPPISIHRIDLEPTGTVFSLDAPRLDGNVYVFTTASDKLVTRVKKERVKKITAISRDLTKLVYWQVELNPTGSILAREAPKARSGGYTLTTLKEGTLMSVRQADVKKITRLEGLEAFKAEQMELGSFVLSGELPDQPGSGRVHGGASAPAPGASPAPQAQGNWTYQGQPGVTDAYAPPSAVQERPGDVPKAAPTPKK